MHVARNELAASGDSSRIERGDREANEGRAYGGRREDGYEPSHELQSDGTKQVDEDGEPLAHEHVQSGKRNPPDRDT